MKRCKTAELCFVEVVHLSVVNYLAFDILAITEGNWSKPLGIWYGCKPQPTSSISDAIRTSKIASQHGNCENL